MVFTDKIYLLSMKQFRNHAAGRAATVGFDGAQFGRKDPVVGRNHLFLLCRQRLTGSSRHDHQGESVPAF